MPKAGRYDYPIRTLDDCVEGLRKAWDTSKSYVQQRDSFGAAIKMSPISGSFNQLVGSMALFGLVETGGGEIRWTDLAKQIIHGKGDEVTRAKEHATRRVALFGDIYEKYGANFTEDNLRLFLKDNAVTDIAEANSLAPVVGKLLKKHLQYLSSSGGVARGERESLEPGKGVAPSEPPSNIEEYKLGTNVLIRLPKEDTLQVWARAKLALDILLGATEK
jgi:hypothetical protein